MNEIFDSIKSIFYLRQFKTHLPNSSRFHDCDRSIDQMLEKLRVYTVFAAPLTSPPNLLHMILFHSLVYEA